MPARPPQSTPRRQTPKCEVHILAGGASTRLPPDKAALRLGRRTLLAWVRSTASQLGIPVHSVRHDAVPGCGPLGGILTALRDSRSATLLFLACDMPFISVGLLRTLRSRLTPGWDAVGVVERGVIGFPLLVRRTALPLVERQWRQRQWSIQSLARALRTRPVRVPPRRAHELWNLNTPADWARARAFWQTRRRDPPGGAGRKRGLSRRSNEDMVAPCANASARCGSRSG